MATTKSIFIAECAPGSIVPSTTASDYIETPITGENVQASDETTDDDTITNDRQPRGSIRTGFGVAGTLNSRFRYGALDHVLESAMFSADWAMVNGTATKVANATVAVDHGAKTLVATLGSPFTGLAVGDWVRLEKAADANHGIAFRISTWTDADNVVYDSWTKTPTTQAATTGITVRSGERIVIGTEERDHAYIKKIAQASQTFYEAILGARFGGLQLTMQPGQLIQLSAPVEARRVVAEFDGNFQIDADGEIVASGGTTVDLATYLASGGGYTAAPGNKVFNIAQSSRGAIIVDGVPSLVVKNYGFNLANNLTGEDVLFYQGAKFVEPGQATLEGEFAAIFNAADLYTKFINDESARLAAYVVDELLRGYIIDTPDVKLTGGGTEIAATGMVQLPFTYKAALDATTSRACQIIRFGND